MTMIAHGSKHWCARLDEEKVRWIRANPEGLTQDEMGRRLGVTQSLISGVVLGRTWKHVS